nr:hypothetical protein BaRGS_001864 [Batillaria attramentaria]
MLTKIGEVEVHVSPHRSLNSSKGVVRDEALAYLSDEELKKQPKMVSSACQTDPIVETFTFQGKRKPQQQKTTSTAVVIVENSSPGSGFEELKLLARDLKLDVLALQETFLRESVRLDLTAHKKAETPDPIYLQGLQQILADFPGFRQIFTDGSNIFSFLKESNLLFKI